MRPTQGYDGGAARNVCLLVFLLFHVCWNVFLTTWPEDTENVRVVSYTDTKARLTLLGDMQVLIVVIFCIIFKIKHILNIMHVKEFDKWTMDM
jgi:hypothetical protein